ncbi:zinc protease [Parabacteroides sp. PFB2-10]|uniref:M16 family metallopeptidase n=1 Tax=Parabacteroides sp. PFB2-10 TaxID=1742405 RepID=UPI002474B2A8|nr:insulinase family protein [Parabacteroides sp. PFB2-10]MDH6312410.1 zinc protease [Parabacteroides sp. PFB2-10]
MLTIKRFILLLLLLLPFADAIQAQQIPYSPESLLPFDPNVKKGTLPNGLTYYIRNNHVPADKVELRLMINAGSILEEEQQQGLAHFLEHLSFKKTKLFPEGDMIRRLEEVGVRFGHELNAYTSFEETIYYLPIASEHLNLGLSVLKEWAVNLSLTDEEIDKERGVILEELRLGDNAGKRLRAQYLPILMEGSLYPERMPIGKSEVLETFPYEELRSFYHRWHRPELMAVVAVGHIDPIETEKKITELFGDIPTTPAGTLSRPLTVVPDHAQAKAVVATDPETRGCSVEISYKHIPRQAVTQRDYVEQNVFDALYASMMNGRLSELVSSMENPPFSDPQAGYSNYFRGVDTYSVYARTTPGDVIRTLQQLAVEDERVLRHGFTETELDRAKAKMLRRFERYYNERDRTASDLLADDYQLNFLSGIPMPGAAFEYGLLQTVLPGITAEQISAKAKEYMTRKNRTVVVTGSEKDGVVYPSTEELIAILDEVKSLEIEPYDDGEVVTELMSYTPAPGKILSQRYFEDVDLYEWELSNGAKVVFKMTDFKNDEILFRSTSDGGFSMYPESYDMSALYATRIQDKSGVNGINNTQLMRLMAGKVISITQSLVMYNESMSGRFSPNDAQDFFQLVYLYHTAPYFDRAEFDKLMRQEKADYESLLVTPENYFGYQINEVINNGNPRRNRWPVPDNLNQVDFDKAVEVYNSRFGNAAGFTYCFVGNIDTVALRPLVETYLAGIPGDQETKPCIVEQYFSSPRLRKTYTYHKGNDESKARVSLRFIKDAVWDKETEFAYRQFVEILNTRIFETLRLEMSGIYGASVSGKMAQAHEQEASLSITFGTNTEAYKQLTERAVFELKKLLAEGPSEEEVARAKEKLRVAHNTALRQNARWLIDIMNAYRYNEKVDSPQERLQAIESLSSDQIRQAGLQYVDTDNYLEFLLLPE